MSLIPALGRQRQVELCETEANMIHRVSSSQLSEAPTEKQNRKEKKKRKPTANLQKLCWPVAKALNYNCTEIQIRQVPLLGCEHTLTRNRPGGTRGEGNSTNWAVTAAAHFLSHQAVGLIVSLRKVAKFVLSRHCGITTFLPYHPLFFFKHGFKTIYVCCLYMCVCT